MQSPLRGRVTIRKLCSMQGGWVALLVDYFFNTGGLAEWLISQIAPRNCKTKYASSILSASLSPLLSYFHPPLFIFLPSVFFPFLPGPLFFLCHVLSLPCFLFHKSRIFHISKVYRMFFKSNNFYSFPLRPIRIHSQNSVF